MERGKFASHGTWRRHRERDLGRSWREKSNLPDEVGFHQLRRPEKAVSDSEAHPASSPGGFRVVQGARRCLKKPR